MMKKEQLLTISEISSSAGIDKMDDRQFSEYCKVLNDFIEDFPSHEIELKKSFEVKDNATFSKTVLTVRDTLTKIHADDLAQNCMKLLSHVENAKNEVAQAYLTYFLTAMSTLSIDIQMALHKDDASNETEAKNKPVASYGVNKVENKEKSILAVDDVSLVLNGLKSALQNSMYKFTGVTSGTAALKFIKNHRPDLFVLDIEMPDMNGYELAKRIKESGQTAPIIFLTGNANKEYVLKAMQLGAVDFIIKPISREHVLEKIAKHIGIK